MLEKINVIPKHLYRGIPVETMMGRLVLIPATLLAETVRVYSVEGSNWDMV